MSSSVKRGMATTTVVGMILLVIGLLVAMGIFGGKILEAAEGVGKAFGIVSAKQQKVQQVGDVLTSFFQTCALEPGTNCVCSTSIDFYLPDAFSEGDALTLERNGSDTVIDLVGTKITIPGVAPCFVTGFPMGFATFNYFIEQPISFSRSFSPDFIGKIIFTYAKEKEKFWLQGTLADSLPLKTLRLVKLDPHYLCLIASLATEYIERECKSINQCWNGKVCGAGETCPTNMIDPYYAGPGVCCNIRCVKKEAPEVEANISQVFEQAKQAQDLTKLREIVEQHPTSEYADDALFEIARIYDAQNKRNEFLEAARKLLRQYPASPYIGPLDTMSDRHLNCGDYQFPAGGSHSAAERAQCTDARDSLLTGCVFIDRNWPNNNECKSCRDAKNCGDIYDEKTCRLSPCTPAGQNRCQWQFDECMYSQYTKDCAAIETKDGCENDPCHPKTQNGCCAWTGSKCEMKYEQK